MFNLAQMSGGMLTVARVLVGHPSLADVAEVTGISPPTLARLERRPSLAAARAGQLEALYEYYTARGIRFSENRLTFTGRVSKQDVVVDIKPEPPAEAAPVKSGPVKNGNDRGGGLPPEFLQERVSFKPHDDDDGQDPPPRQRTKRRAASSVAADGDTE